MRTPPNERLTPHTAHTVMAGTASRPERRCILTGESQPRGALLRLALSPDGVVLPDIRERAPGRGAWIGVSRAELEEALAKGRLKAALSRAFKTGAVTIPENLAQRVEDALVRALLDRLGLELRVGNVLLGTQRILEHARGGAVTLLLHASDASEDGRRKLDQAWRVGREAEGSGERGITLPLDREALSVALGRDNVVHLALGDDAAATRVMTPLARLMQYNGLALPAHHSDAPAAASRDDERLSERETS